MSLHLHCRKLSLWKRLSSSVAARQGQSEKAEHYDVIMAGGGIMGCCAAYFLAQRVPPTSLCVIERDLTYKKASTVLSVGSIRQQFSTKGNILMSLFSSHFLRNISTHLQVEGEEPPDAQFQDGSYLFLATEEGERIMRENYELQKSVGASILLLEPRELQRKFPWINTEGIKLASLGVKNEGWMDPWMLLSALKKKLLSLGVRFLEADITGVTVEQNEIKKVKFSISRSAEEAELSCSHLVNTAGAWGARLALMAGVGDKDQVHPSLQVPLPVTPRKRCVFVVKCPSGPVHDCPLVVDTKGVYIRKESAGDTFLTGTAPAEHQDIDTDDLVVDHSLFEETIWPAIAHRVPAFESLKVQSAWAGFYEYNTLDQNAIIGHHPVISNLIFANGFSGHGFQQAPAVGRAVSEVILDGATHSIDLSDFSFQRIIDNQPLRERNVV